MLCLDSRWPASRITSATSGASVGHGAGKHLFLRPQCRMHSGTVENQMGSFSNFNILISSQACWEEGRLRAAVLFLSYFNFFFFLS